MKKLLSIFLALVMVLSVLGSISAAVPVGSAINRKVVVVHNAKEFYKALKSNIDIKLMPGDYNMENVVKGKYALYNSIYTGYYSVQGATIKNLKNVRIFSDSNVLMYSSQANEGIAEDNVLIFSNCSNITLENITFGHKSKEPDTIISCIAGVLALNNCKNVLVRDCDLFGCGYTGFTMEKCSIITIIDSKIHDCEASAFWLYQCKNIVFAKSEIYNNGLNETFNKLGQIIDSTRVALSQCSIHDNGGLQTVSDNVNFMFDGVRGELLIDQCAFTNNHY